VVCGTRGDPVPLLPSGLRVRGTSLHRARSSTLRHSRPFPANAEKSLAQRLQPQPECAASAFFPFPFADSFFARESPRRSGFWLCCLAARRIRRLHLGRFTQFTLNGPRHDLHNRLALHSANAAFIFASLRNSDVHGCEFFSSKVSPMPGERFLQHG